MAGIALMAWTAPMLQGQQGDRIRCTGVAIDLASAVETAPPEKLVGIENRLLDVVTSSQALADRVFGLGQPPLIVGFEVGIDGQPSRPVFFVEPRDGDLRSGHVDPLSGAESLPVDRADVEGEV